MALIPEMDRVSTVDCFNIECGFKTGELPPLYFFVAFDFFSMSIGTGLIITLELFFNDDGLGIKGGSSLGYEKYLDALMVYTFSLGDASTFSLRRWSKLVMPLFLSISSVAASFFFLSYVSFWI